MDCFSYLAGCKLPSLLQPHPPLRLEHTSRNESPVGHQRGYQEDTRGALTTPGTGAPSILHLSQDACRTPRVALLLLPWAPSCVRPCFQRNWLLTHSLGFQFQFSRVRTWLAWSGTAAPKREDILMPGVLMGGSPVSLRRGVPLCVSSSIARRVGAEHDQPHSARGRGCGLGRFPDRHTMLLAGREAGLPVQPSWGAIKRQH